MDISQILINVGAVWAGVLTGIWIFVGMNTVADWLDYRRRTKGLE